MSLNIIDLSSWQAGIDLEKMKSDGIDGVIVKIDEGLDNGGSNPQAAQWFAEAFSLDLLVGDYHFAQTNNPVQEAQDHIKVRERLGLVNKSLPVLDYEGAALKNWTVEAVKQYLDTLKASFRGRPMLYSSQTVFDILDWSPVENAGYKLWLAQYANENLTGIQTTVWTNASARTLQFTLMQQYSSTGKLAGWAGSLDLDLFKGTRADWLELAGAQRIKSKVEENLMRFTYEIIDAKTNKSQGTIYYYDGTKDIALSHIDQLNIERKIYQEIMGEELKHYQWRTDAPWYVRHLQATGQKNAVIAWK
jgi:lysozyme